MIWVGAATVLIVLILGPAVFLSMSKFNERSEQLAALEKALLATSEQLAAREEELRAISAPIAAPQAAPSEVQAPQAPTSKPSILCETSITEPATAIGGIEPPPLHVCADADLAFWQNLVTEIYQHRWRQLDTNGRQILRQGQLDWLGKLRNDCNAAFQVPVSGTEMARAKSCVLQSIKKRVAVLTNN